MADAEKQPLLPAAGGGAGNGATTNRSPTGSNSNIPAGAADDDYSIHPGTRNFHFILLVFGGGGGFFVVVFI